MKRKQMLNALEDEINKLSYSLKFRNPQGLRREELADDIIKLEEEYRRQTGNYYYPPFVLPHPFKTRPKSI